MHNILCPLCDGDHSEVVATRIHRGLTVITVLCLGCGLVYHNPVVTDKDVPPGGRPGCCYHTNEPLNRRHLTRSARRLATQIDFLVSALKPGSSVLEVGAGLGLLSHWAQEQGAGVTGVEADPEQASYARTRFGLNIIAAPFEDCTISGPFDLLMASHVIEHVTDPHAFLDRLRLLAAPEAFLFLETPNLLTPKVSPRRLFSLAHNFYFTPATLGGLLLRCGWRPVKIREFHRDSFQVLARPCEPVQVVIPTGQAQQVKRAWTRHRYLYYLQGLFVLRKIPLWQRHWMYRFREYSPGPFLCR